MKDVSLSAIGAEEFSAVATQLKLGAVFLRTRALKAQHAAIRKVSAALLPSTLERVFVGSH